MLSPFSTPPSSTSSASTPVLSEVLGRLGLPDYLDVLIENGFHTWETVLDITEDDLCALSFKLGHRRALQREIATFRGLPRSLSLDLETPSSESSISASSPVGSPAAQMINPLPREKRRYRRHPRPDHNAPKKPNTAYVNFADQLRSSPEVGVLSFVEVAKEVGRRWQALSLEKKRIWESRAALAMQEYESQLNEYKQTENWRRYQAYLREFKLQQGEEPKSKPRSTLRTDILMHKQSSRESSVSASSDSPGSFPPSFTSAKTEPDLCHNALVLALDEVVSLRGEILKSGARPYNEQNLPPENLVRRAMYAFVEGTGSLLYMWTHAQVEEILERVYRPSHLTDALALSECFIVAAMGAHYDMECFPDHIRQVLYASGSLRFDEKSARIDHFRTMRLLLSMSFYALLEKHMSARYLVAAGLQIARSKFPPSSSSRSDMEGEIWRRIFRSLIFMDCWLSYTLGYTSRVTAEDISAACTPHQPGVTSLREIIHVQTSKVGLVAAEIAKTLTSPEMTTHDNIKRLAQKLERWRVEVPAELQISALTSANPSTLTLFQRRAILMLHLMYLGALILLYRQLLLVSAEIQSTDGTALNLGLSIEDARRYMTECAIAAQQIARILRLISFDGTLTKRCWLLIYWSFTGCVVLLFSATTKLLDGQTEGVEEILTHAKGCMDTLEPCRDFEPIAARYLDIVWPLYDSLRDINQRTIGRAKTSIYMLLQSDSTQLSPPIPVSREEMKPILEKLSMLLADPFGRKQGRIGDPTVRQVVHDDGSCSVFWWR